MPTIKGIVNGAKNVIVNLVLEVAQLTLYKHHQATRIDTARTYQATLTTQHTLAQLLVSTLILATTYCRVELTEVEIRKVTRRAGCRTRAATDAGLQLGHLGDDGIALSKVVIIQIDNTRPTDGITKVHVTHIVAFLAVKLTP